MAHRFKVAQGGPCPHFITNTIVEWLPVFTSEPYVKIIFDSLEHLRRHRGLAVHAYVIMPTHMHAILTAGNDDLSGVMRDFKKFTSRAIYEQADKEGNQLLTRMFREAAKRNPRSRFKVWQDGFHPEAICSRRFFLQKLDYLHANPIRRGLVNDAGEWYYTSFITYETGQEGPLEIDRLEW